MPLDQEFIEAESKKNEERIARAQEFIRAEADLIGRPELVDAVVIAVKSEPPLGLVIWIEGREQPIKLHGLGYSLIWHGR